MLTVVFFFAVAVSQRLRLQRSITYLGAQLIDSFFRLIALGGSGLLPDDIIIIDDSRPIIFPLVVKLRDAKGVAGLLVFQQPQILSSLRRLLALWIAKQEIFKTRSWTCAAALGSLVPPLRAALNQI